MKGILSILLLIPVLAFAQQNTNSVFEVNRQDRYTFIDKENRAITLPGKPYMALRITRIDPDDTIKIMPVGNSITAGEHYGYPALEERTGYRKALYEMLIHNGYNVDFVGSQMHGIRSEEDVEWYDWNCEAYPGWKIPEIAKKVDAALEVYEPDILLVHVGTNGSDWKDKPQQVKDMLDGINRYSVRNHQPLTVFLCLIMNRFKNEDPAPTTKFNRDVRKMVNSRSGDKIRIILVDMENEAGLDYSDDLPNTSSDPPYEGGDMLGYSYPGVPYDKYHPNDKGNTKLAVKLYKELVKMLQSNTEIKENR